MVSGLTQSNHTVVYAFMGSTSVNPIVIHNTLFYSGYQATISAPHMVS